MISIDISYKTIYIIADYLKTEYEFTKKAQIMELLNELQQYLNMTTIIITHDLGVVANMAHRVVVMYGGKVAETGTVDEIFYEPKHPYTWGLLSSVPKLDSKGKKLIAIDGSPPNLANPPKGCPFASRCPHAMNICIDHAPEVVHTSTTQKTACWLLDEKAPTVKIPETARIEG